jgi:hypothetical protein
VSKTLTLANMTTWSIGCGRCVGQGPDPVVGSGAQDPRRKNAAAARHAMRAATLLRQLMNVPDRAIERALGTSPVARAEYAEAATRIPAESAATAPGEPQTVFNFILGQIPAGGRADRKRQTVFIGDGTGAAGQTRPCTT